MIDDDLRDMLLERLHADPDAWRRLIRDLATDRPLLPARDVEAALLAAAAALDQSISRAGAPTDEARTARRLAALLAIDIERTEGAPTMGDLMALWRDDDDFFLRL